MTAGLEDAVQGEYSTKEERPLRGYLGLMAAFSAFAGTAALLGRNRAPQRMAPGDLALAIVASHKLSRLLTKDSITSALRAPLVRYVEPAGEGEVNEEVRVDGPLHAVAELAICPICLDVWTATAFVGGFAIAPRATRWAATLLTVTAAANLLHLSWDKAKDVAG